MSALEWSLLRGTTSFDQPQPSRSYSLAVSLVEADFKAVLLSAEAKHVFERSPKLFEGLAELQEGPTATHLALGQDDQFILYTVAIALLQSFVQSNWTGPDLTFAPLDLIPSSGSNISNEKLNASSLPFLTLQGEPAYHLCSQPALLLLSIRLLKLLSAQTAPPATLPWWLLRSHLVHQALLDEPIELQPDVLAVVRDLPQSMPDDPELLASLRLELGLYHHSLGHDKLANQEFLAAAQASGLEFELTGAMGKRTKFQIELHSQLVLLAESRHRIGEDDKPPDHAAGTNGNGHVPEALPLNDDTLLEETEFTKRTSSDGSGSSRLSHLDPASQPPLNPLDQSLLLSLCLSQHNHSPASGLTASQMMPFISRVLSHPRNWSIHTTALLLRSRLQSTRSRTVERSTLQLAALIEQMPTSDSCPQERLEYFHQLPLPSKWEMERELAKRYLSLGVVRSALDIFTRLEMWEDAVGCLQRMERESEAEAIVRDLLAGRKVESDLVHELGRASLSERRKIKLEAGREAKLWCLLGDITLTSENARKDPDAAKSTAAEHYEKAWEVSGKTSSRAMRTLGSLHFSAKEYDLAIPCSKAGLDINPLFARAWFTLGVCYVRLERWSEARDAFRKEVGVDDEDAEGWNNLAAVYLRLGETGCSSSGVSD